MPSQTFRVIWEIDVDAESPREAALVALGVQRRPESSATVFRVRDYFGNESEVDLSSRE